MGGCMRENKNNVIKNGRRTKPHFIVTHEYSSSQSMQAAFEQVAENEVCRQFERWQKENIKAG